jgi:hypothetical protein
MCWTHGAKLAAAALREHAIYGQAEVDFVAIAAAAQHVVPSNRDPGKTFEGRATMMMPFGPGYDDNGRPGVSANIVPRPAQ